MNSILDQITHDSVGPPADGAPAEKKPSVFQERIYEEVSGSVNNILVEAVAGSGKTTTLVRAIQLAVGRSLSLAFNKSIADEMRVRIGSAGDTKTLNALGHRSVMQNRPRAQLDMDKLKKLARRIITDSEDYGDWSYSAMRAVGLAKNNAVGIDCDASQGDFKDMLDNYLDVPANAVDRVAGYAFRIYQQSLVDVDTFDFDDQLYLPILNNWPYNTHYDNVFVDEAQDLSPIQHLMLLAMGDCRTIAVGDRHQAIYGFRGASHESMDILQKRFKMIELPLSITYRCPLSVVKLAQQYCPHIQAREGAQDGQVNYREELHDLDGLPCYTDPKLFQSGLVLCRTNAPLFKAILRHIRAKEPCRVLSNFLDSFHSFIKSLAKGVRGGIDSMPVAMALKRLDRWYESECEAADGRRGKLAYLQDKYETVKLLLEEYPTVGDAAEAVRRLAQSRSGPTFATIHKAKGLEERSVYILRPDLMPSPWASGEEERLQEDNLSYVAITRAIETLTFGVRER